MRIRIHEGFIEHHDPYLLHKLDLEEMQNFSRCWSPIFLAIRVLDSVGELRKGTFLFQ